MPATLPNPKQAYDHLFGQVSTRAFFGRLAQHGLQPQNEKQAAEYLKLAGKLRIVDQDPRVKAAEAKNDPIAEANSALDNVMSKYGFANTTKTAQTQEADVARRAVAMQLAQDAGIYDSVLSLKAAEASEIAAQIGYAA